VALNLVSMESNDWDLCLTGNSVAPSSVAAGLRRASSQSRVNVASARSQYSVVSIVSNCYLFVISSRIYSHNA